MCVEGESGEGLQIEISSLSSSLAPTLLLQDSCLLCKQVVLTIRGDSMGFHIVRPELVMSRFGCWY